nr:reverse transcriptase domain-containing protein [Tanacetum cinerariifolium]
MSSHNAQSAVTYTSISSNSDGPSWGIPLMNAGELSGMNPYEEASQQGQAHPLSPTYVPDPMELDEHVPVYVTEPKHPEYHAPSDDDIQVEDDDEDPKEDPSEENEPEDDDEDLEEDPNEEHEPKDKDTKEPSKGSDETEPFEEDKIVVTSPPPRHHGARISAHLGHRASMIRRRDDILKEDMPPRRRFALTGPPPGCDVVESSAVAARAPRSQYKFVDTIEAGQGLIRSPGHNTQTIARAADRAEDVGYVRALHASECRMMTSIEEVNLRVSYQAQVRRQKSANFYTQLLVAQTDRRDIRLEVDVVRGQRTAYETELQEVHQAYLSSEARNRELTMPVTRQGTNDAMTPESIQAMIDREIQRNSTHTQEDASQSSGEGLRRPVQPARVCSYTDFMKCQPLNFKGTEGVVGLVKGNDVAAYTQRFQELALMCTKFLADKTKKFDKYISRLPDNIHGNVMSARPKTLDETIELANGNGYSKNRQKQGQKRQNQTPSGKDQKRQSHSKPKVKSQSPRSTKVNPVRVKVNPDKAEAEQ